MPAVVSLNQQRCNKSAVQWPILQAEQLLSVFHVCVCVCVENIASALSIQVQLPLWKSVQNQVMIDKATILTQQGLVTHTHTL